MDDTPEDFKSMYRRKIMERSGEERVMMGDSMFASAREMVLASLPNIAADGEKRFQLFLRFYGSDFVPEQQKRIQKLFLTRPA